MPTVWNRFLQNKPLLKEEFTKDIFIKESGYSYEELQEHCKKIDNKPNDFQQNKAEQLCFIFNNASLGIVYEGWFADRLDAKEILLPLRNTKLESLRKNEMKNLYQKYGNAMEDRAFFAGEDFGHTCPDWECLLSLGIQGIIKRIENRLTELENENRLTEDKAIFLNSTKATYLAIADTFKRISNATLLKADEFPHLKKVSEAYLNLSNSAPNDILEAMQLISAIFFWQTHIECTNVRSLGRLDKLLRPFYFNDITSGRYTKEQIFELLQYFMYRFYAADIIANVPFALGGADETLNGGYDEFSLLILEAYDSLKITSPKIHIRVDEFTPDYILKKVVEIIKGGNSSFVFTNDKVVVDSLQKIGITKTEAENYVMIGCYEPSAAGKEVPCTCNGQISLPKAVEYALSGGVDLLSGNKNGADTPLPTNYDEFISAVKRQIEFLCNAAMKVVNENEKHYLSVHSSPIFSGTLFDCVKNGTDAYGGGAKYNNSSLCAIGIATATDSIFTVKKLVFEDKLLSLTDLTKILKNNWQTEEKLHLKIKKLPKYGNNIEKIDDIATDLLHFCAQYINGSPNGRGGVFRTGAFSIDWRHYYGQVMAASPDGRRCGETISKNLSATAGYDKEGVTAAISTAGKIDFSLFADGGVLDVVVHPSAVRGNAGSLAMVGLIKSYFEQGGMAIQFNVFDPSILRKAQLEPEKYATLQVRLCGWNVYFTDLSKIEQDEFILQAENTQ